MKIIDPMIETMGRIANEGRIAILKNDVDKLATLMNFNQGLLDSLGVNTQELSRMIYIARKNGATGSKITGSGCTTMEHCKTQLPYAIVCAIVSILCGICLVYIGINVYLALIVGIIVELLILLIIGKKPI